ncbi:DUF547 domain-containing protein [Ferrimonas marina]|uniref:DUF547 domain-containing protein n=1 Tax=Ferrimonas marina TaxID=299255 RepID=A0A1M5MF87_9GAMM|nr:DUF547 domain-containing protein [Ferrimonas marina]SHG75906.1 Protein of unknown function, DUF547 [Ferrimonas marina]
MKLMVAMLTTLVLAGCATLTGHTQLNLDHQSTLPSQGIDHAPFARLLDRYLDEQGRVHYQAWFDSPEDRAELDRYLSQVAQISPESDPDRFPTPADRLAYWVNAYNAWVIKAVLTHWPLESVQDVTARVELVRGYGFFYSLQIQVGGETTNLYKLERDKILKRIEEPRLHFVLNCASTSCPPLRPIPPASEDMEATLQQASWDFLRQADGVRVDHSSRQVRVSEIFDWYQEDFVRGSDQLGLDYDNDDQAVIRYLQAIAPPEMQPALSEADSYQLVYFDYDWSINQSPP